MARFRVKMPDDYLKRLRELTNQTIPICKKAVIAGAAPIADKIRSNANSILSSEATGEMLSGFGIAPPDIDDKGVINTKIGFGGVDSKGKPNSLKANALESGRVKGKDGANRKHKKRTGAEWARAVESGTSIQPKRPFIRPAVNSTRKKSMEAMGDVINEEIKKLME